MQQKIFDIFTQVESNTSRNFQGSGLGTTIAQQMVTLMGRTIKLKSTKKIGTEILFSLKLLHSLNTAENIKPDNQGMSQSNQFQLKDLEVLLVEDYPPNQQLAIIHLKKLGCRTTLAVNGMEAVYFSEKKKFDLILMDMQMPEMDGLEATRKIRKQDISIPIIGITANAFESDTRRCLESGMNGVLKKPFRKNEFIQELAIALNTRISIQQQNTSKTKDPTSPIDCIQLVEDLYSEKDLFIEILNGFIKETEKSITAINNNLKNKEFSEIHRNAHSIKGGAMNIHASKLKTSAENLEYTAKNKKEENLKSLFEKLQSSFNTVKHYCSNPEKLFDDTVT